MLRTFFPFYYVKRLTLDEADGILVSIRKERKFESKGRPKHV